MGGFSLLDQYGQGSSLQSGINSLNTIQQPDQSLGFGDNMFSPGTPVSNRAPTTQVYNGTIAPDITPEYANSITEKSFFGDNTEQTKAIAGAGLALAGTVASGIGELSSSRKDRKAEERVRQRLAEEEALNRAENERQQKIQEEIQKRINKVSEEKVSFFERIYEMKKIFADEVAKTERDMYATEKFKNSGAIQRQYMRNSGNRGGTSNG